MMQTLPQAFGLQAVHQLSQSRQLDITVSAPITAITELR
jgi:hypothetical protein